MQNFTNQKFGKWTALYPVDKKGVSYWYCKCDCGTEREVSEANLKKGRSTSCGKCNKSANLVGMRFHKLTVLERDYGVQSKDAHWKCQCDCGNVKTVSGKHLKDGTTKSCGCLRKERGAIMCAARAKNLAGNTFGQLTVLHQIESPNHHSYWACKCSCGNDKIVRGDYLTGGHVISCGCTSGSLGEQKIEQLLREFNLSYTKEKKFSDCVNPKTGYPLRFDFYVNNTYLIEYDGIQHFEENDFFPMSLSDIRELDRIKDLWCQEHQIPLLRIPYTKLPTLTIEDLKIKEARL